MQRQGGPDPFETIAVSFFMDKENGIEIREVEMKVPIGAGQFGFCAALKGINEFLVEKMPKRAKKSLQGSDEEEFTIKAHIDARLREWQKLMSDAETQQREKSENSNDQGQSAGNPLPG